VEYHDGGVTAEPPIDITWVGTGAVSTWSNTSRYDDGGSPYYVKEAGTSRTALIADGSYIGAMGFTDDPDDTSSGSLSSWKVYERVTTR
jgi:hypothetical protein